MARHIDAEHDQEGGQAAVIRLRPATAMPLPRPRRAVQALPLPPRSAPKVSRKPIWDKHNVGFWLAACIVLSLLFSIAYRALG
jgi:hypothetical protein